MATAADREGTRLAADAARRGGVEVARPAQGAPSMLADPGDAELSTAENIAGPDGGDASTGLMAGGMVAAHGLGGHGGVSFDHNQGDGIAVADQPDQLLLDARAVQAQLEALMKSQLGPAAHSTALADIAAIAAVALSNDTPAARNLGGLYGSESDVIPSSTAAAAAATATGIVGMGHADGQLALPLGPRDMAASASPLDGRAHVAPFPAPAGSNHDDLPASATTTSPRPVDHGFDGSEPRGMKRPRAEEEGAEGKSQKLHLDEETARLLRELEAVAKGLVATPATLGGQQPQQQQMSSTSSTASTSLPLAPDGQTPPQTGVVTTADDAAVVAAGAAAAGGANPTHSFQNTFAQYQYPQSHHLAFKEAVRAASVDGPRYRDSPSGSDAAAATEGEERRGESSTGMTREEEERAADALIQDIDAVEAAERAAASGAASHDAVAQKGADGAAAVGPIPSNVEDLAAVAQAAMGLDEDSNPLPGNEESHRALAEAVKRLSAQHEQAVQQAASAAASSGAGAEGVIKMKEAPSGVASASPSIAADASAASPKADGDSHCSASRAGSSYPPVKRFQCPRCERAFARAFNLNTHLATHDPDPSRSKPYPCPYPSCKSEGGRAFSRKHDLQRHVASVHEFEPEPGINGDPGETHGDTGGLASLGLGTPGKKFRCEACGRSFVRRDACNRHQCSRRSSSARPEDGSVGPEGSTSPAPGLSPVAASIQPRLSPKPTPTPTPKAVLLSGNPISLYHSGPSTSAVRTNATPARVLPPPVNLSKQSSAATSTASGPSPRASSSTTPAPTPAPTPASAPASTSMPAHAAETAEIATTSRPAPATQQPTPAPAGQSTRGPSAPSVTTAVRATPDLGSRSQAPHLTAAPSTTTEGEPQHALADNEAEHDEGFSQEVQDIGRRLLAQARAQDRKLSSQSSKVLQPQPSRPQPQPQMTAQAQPVDRQQQLQQPARIPSPPQVGRGAATLPWSELQASAQPLPQPLSVNGGPTKPITAGEGSAPAAAAAVRADVVPATTSPNPSAPSVAPPAEKAAAAPHPVAIATTTAAQPVPTTAEISTTGFVPPNTLKLETA